MPPLPKFVSFLRAMKGARLSVLLACWCSSKPLTNSDLQDFTGYNQDTVRKAVHDLVEAGWLLAISSQGPWRLDPEEDLPFAATAPRQPGPRPPTRAAGSPTGLAKPSAKSEKIRRQWEAWLDEQDDEDRRYALHLFEVLTYYKIKTPISWQLAMLPDLTPDLIRDHVEVALKQGYDLGTAISRMAQGWDPPRILDYEKLNHPDSPGEEN